MVKEKAAGSFLGGFANNPGVVIIAVVAIALFLFRDRISNAFASIGEGFGSINIDLPAFPTFEFPTFEFPTFEFPTIEFPSFEFPNVGDALGSIGESITEAVGQVLNPQGAPTTESEGEAVDFTESGMAAARGERGETGDVPSVEEVLEGPTGGVTVAPSLLDTVIAPFVGGGPSFEGGTIFETPIEFLSLSQIIDRFMVSATEAASIRAEAIGFTEEEQIFLAQGEVDVGGFVAGGPPAVSDPSFEGLTIEEIALRLTGGNISNF